MIKSRTDLFSLMQRRARIITPNNRLSSELINDFFRSNPQQIQDKPHCLPYSAFLQNCFKTVCHHFPQKQHPIILTKQQVRYLWLKILDRSSKSTINEGLIQALEEAWTRCHLWQVDFHHPSFAHTPQTSQFQQWALELKQELNEIRAITEAEIANYLLSQEFDYQYQSLVWVCFDDYTPQQIALQQYFSAQNTANFHHDLAEPGSELYCYHAKDNNDEYQQLILWLKERIAQGEQRIAVVVPELQSEAHQLKRLLQQQLPVPFNISLGLALADYPLVASALCWLELDCEQFTAFESQLMLYSPYLAHSKTEMLARVQCREESRILQERVFSKASLTKELNTRAPKLATLLDSLLQYPEKDSPKGWVNHFKTRLGGLGFPGEYPLNSASYQCYQRFLGLFDEFKLFTVVTSELTKSEALSLFKNLAKSTIFQANKAEVNIQILGLLEAAGSTFDSLWVSGLTDQCLPKKAKLSAFIPISLQREKLMPYASPARELQLAQKSLTRLGNSGRLVIFSYPQLSEDKPNLPSPLLKAFQAFPGYEITELASTSPLVNWVESYAIPFAEGEVISGGTALLANQAKCPFRSFAAHRLHVKSVLKVSDGPSDRERGQLIHRVMELLWLALNNQQKLLSLSKSELDDCIEQAIISALESLIVQRPHSFSALIQEIELTKLKKLVYASLDWEKQRQPFAVEALEQAFNIHLAGIDFKVRVDRLDKLEDGNKWVIDYKSSLPTSLPWKEDRPKEPQLLLYALLDETINGLLFAQLKAGQMHCKGLSEENHSLPGLSTIKKGEDWNDYRQHWQTQLQELAQEFSEGQCIPQPSTATVCQLCDFQSLCRFVVRS